MALPSIRAILVGALAGLLLLGSAAGSAQEGTFVYHLNAQPENLDPAKCSNQRCQRVMWPIFERLMDLSANAKTLMPGLAERWESADGLTYTFHLRKGVAFHDGSPFNAAAVKANLERNYLQGSEFYTATPRNVREKFLAGLIKKVRAQDEHTLVVTLTEPAFDLLYLVPIVSPKALEIARREKRALVDPVGTGPFQFARQSATEIRLEAYPGYWGGRPALREVLFRIIPDSRKATQELLAGQVDFLPEVEPLLRPRIRAHPAARIIPPVETLSLYYLGFRVDRPPLSDGRVRQAVAKAINVPRMVGRLLEDMAAPAQGPLPRGVEGYDGGLRQFAHDPHGARQILQHAAPAASHALSLVFNAHWEFFRQVAVAIKEDLATVGLHLDLAPVAGYGELVRAVQAGRGDLFLYNWFFPLTNPRVWLEPLFHSASVDNLTRYRNAEVDGLLDRARAAVDPSLRLDLYRKVQQILLADPPMVFLFHDVRVSAVLERVKHLELNNQSWPVDRFRRIEVQPE